MANYPYSFTGEETLQPGARGEIFQSDIPGYRNQGDRVNRTNFTLGTCEHDVPNIKYELDFQFYLDLVMLMVIIKLHFQREE